MDSKWMKMKTPTSAEQELGLDPNKYTKNPWNPQNYFGWGTSAPAAYENRNLSFQRSKEDLAQELGNKLKSIGEQYKFFNEPANTQSLGNEVDRSIDVDNWANRVMANPLFYKYLPDDLRDDVVERVKQLTKEE